MSTGFNRLSSLFHRGKGNTGNKNGATCSATSGATVPATTTSTAKTMQEQEEDEGRPRQQQQGEVPTFNTYHRENNGGKSEPVINGFLPASWATKLNASRGFWTAMTNVL